MYGPYLDFDSTDERTRLLIKVSTYEFRSQELLLRLPGRL